MSVKIIHMASRGGDTGIKKPAAASRVERESGGGRWLVADEGSPRVGLPEKKQVARLSHDIRTQLYIIIGFAELMLEEIPGKINDEQRRNLKDVLNSGRRLQELLQDIVAQSESK